MAFVPLVPSLSTASADNLNPVYNVSLWDTKWFQGYGGEWFWGTAFFYQALNEGNLNYDWYFVGLKFHRQNPIGTIWDLDSRMTVADRNGREVWQVDAEPWYKDPFSGDLDLSVGYGTAAVTVHLESNGYDRGTWYHYSSSVQNWWAHDFTRADSTWWSTKSGAMVAKVQEVSGNSLAMGVITDIYFMWFAWDWGCWCDLQRQRHASFPDGQATNYNDATPGG